ncbi:glycoside hydrolase family 25 protein [Paraburkholderia caribensis]|uniref:glycoside hydrolase family 25 protein n=1 Tax=Paraburkholderia caribensis TaxID=75105 RepID=UPI0031E06388
MNDSAPQENEARTPKDEVDAKGKELESKPKWKSEDFKNIALGVAGVISSVCIPLLGLHYTNQQSARESERTSQQKAQEVAKGFVELGVKILSDRPTEDNQPLRKWAIDLINQNATIKLPRDAENALLHNVPLVSDSATSGITSKSVVDSIINRGYTLGVVLTPFDRASSVSLKTLKESGIEFIYIKDNNPSVAAELANEASKVGLHVGLYHFFWAQRDADAQFKLFMSSINSVSTDLPPVVDCEGVAGNATKEFANRALDFIARIAQEGHLRPVVYVDKGFADEYLDARFSKYPLWIAKMSYDEKTEPTLPKWWTSYALWHFAVSAGVPALQGRNVIAFKGSLPELIAFGRSSKQP